MTAIPDRRTLLLLFFGFSLRLGYSAYALERNLSVSHNDEYETIAINLVDHFRYAGLAGKPTPTAAREPGFPVLIALVYFVFGKRPLIFLAAQAALSLLTCLLIREMARDLFGEEAAGIAFVLAVFYPYFIFYCAYFYKETLLSCTLAGLLHAAGRLARNPRPGLAVPAGLLAGLCAVTLSTYLVMGLAVGAWLAWTIRGRAKAWGVVGTYLAAMALFPLIWTGRNLVVFHRLIPGSTIGGFNLYTALIVPEDQRGTSREILYETRDPHWSRIMAMSELMADDGSQQAAFISASLQWVRRHPFTYAAHAVKQALKLWRLYPYERSYQHDYRLIKAASLLSDGWIIPLGLLGLFLYWKRSGLPALFAVVLVSGTATYALISAIVRYRLPLMAPLLVLAGGVLAQWRKTLIRS